MFKKNDGDKLAALESELAGKREAHELAVSNFATTRDKADALADRVARAALTGDLDLQNLEAELEAAERRARAFASARNQVGIEIRELEQRLDLEKTRGQRDASAQFLEGVADQIIAVVTELRPGKAKLQAAMESSRFLTCWHSLSQTWREFSRIIFFLAPAQSRAVTRKRGWPQSGPSRRKSATESGPSSLVRLRPKSRMAGPPAIPACGPQ